MSGQQARSPPMDRSPKGTIGNSRLGSRPRGSIADHVNPKEKNMRFTRMLLLPFACLGLMAALMVFSPVRAVDYGPMVSAYDNLDFDLTLPIALIERIAIVEETAVPDAPADAHRVDYTIANQPLAAWRIAADMGYDHIDPHRRVV